MKGFSINGVEPSVSITKELVNKKVNIWSLEFYYVVDLPPHLFKVLLFSQKQFKIHYQSARTVGYSILVH